jgi:twitching motility protein PilI
MAARTSLRDYQRDLAERLRSAEAGATTSRLGLQVGAEAWLVDLAEAGEVLPVPAITPVPLTRPWFRGLTNIRGNLYSVVDFPAFLGGQPVATGPEARLLVLAERFRLGAALLVDRSLGLKNAAHLEPGEAGADTWSRGRYADRDGRQWKELDLPALAQHPDFLAVAL